MLDFDYSIPTKIFFGKGRLSTIIDEIKQYSDRVLLTYGCGSIKKIGLYDDVIKIFEKNEIFYKELSGIQPNPRITSVYEGVSLCRKYDLDFILAIGGGSTIDCSKTIAAGVFYEGDPWDFHKRVAIPTKAIPLGSILTLSATGSEMNGGTVVSKEDTHEKLNFTHPILKPKFSLLDPTYTYTVSKYQTAAGSVDIFVHVVEQYFSLVKSAFIQDKLAEAIMKTCIKYAPLAIEKPYDYEARANLMWASSLALNGLLSYGKVADWATHLIEHALSAFYDITHGVGLSILLPHWMRHVLDETTLYKFVQYAENVWNIHGNNDFDTAEKAIDKTCEFFCSIGMPKTLSEVGIDSCSLEEMARKSVYFGDIGNFKKLNERDVLDIMRAAL